MKTLTRPDLQGMFQAIASTDITPLREFLFSNPSQPLVATGSGGAESAADLAALLYGARCGIAQAVTPYTLNSFSDAALSTSKILLVSVGGHNNDIVFAARRALAVSPKDTALLCFHRGERNKVDGLFQKDGTARTLCYPIESVPDGFVANISPFKFFGLMVRAFSPGCDLKKFACTPEKPYSIGLNDGTNLELKDFSRVKSFTILHGSWGRPAALSLEGKMVESGYVSASVCDFRNFCHGRFIHASNHMEDSAVVLLVSPRERNLAMRIRRFLPARTMTVTIATIEDAPESTLDLLIRSSEFFLQLCEAMGVNPESPSNPGRIDKRIPMGIPFISDLKKAGPLTIR